MEESKGQAAEEAKQENKSVAEFVEEAVQKRSYLQKMGELVNGAKNFNKRKAILKLFGDLMGTGPVQDIVELFDGQDEVLFAVILQNMMHPRNSNRTDAIKAGKYVEIMNLEQARAYIDEMVRFNLTNELRAAETSTLNAFSNLQKNADFKMIVEAPDVYIAAVALSNTEFFNGRGDRSAFFDIILKLDPRQIPDLGNKLMLVKQDKFMGLDIYRDKKVDLERVAKKTLFQLWLHCCRKSNAVRLEQMIAFAPYQEEYLRNQDRFVDAEGRTTLNMEEYMEHRRLAAEAKAKDKKKKNAKKAAKTNF